MLLKRIAKLHLIQEMQREQGAGELIEGSEQQACHGRRATACKKGVHGGEVEAEPGADSDRVGCCKG
jgi:hypothetical protein